MLIHQATKKALQGQGKVTRANALWTFSYLDVHSLPVILVSERTGSRKVWNPTKDDLLADDWQAI